MQKLINRTQYHTEYAIWCCRLLDSKWDKYLGRVKWDNYVLPLLLLLVFGFGLAAGLCFNALSRFVAGWWAFLTWNPGLGDLLWIIAFLWCLNRHIQGKNRR